MKALVVERRGEPGVADRRPPDLGATDVEVSVRFAAICHTDHFVIGGGHPLARYPIVPGHEVCGVISAVGEAVSDPQVGDRVAVVTQVGCGACAACARGDLGACPTVRHLGSTVDGGWQEAVAVPARATRVIPSGVALRGGALIEPAANAHALVTAAEVREDDVVLVLGPGPIGLLAGQFARLAGAARVAVAGLPADVQRLRTAVELGTDVTVAAPPDELARAIRERLAEPPSVVLQCAPSVSALATALEVVGRRGRVLVEGYAASAETVALSPDRLGVDELSLRGVNGWKLHDFEAALDAVAAGHVDVESLITHTFPLERFEEALTTSTDYESGALRVVFELP